MKTPELENLGSLITVKGTNECLGDLMHFAGHGVYDPTHGLVPVTKEQAYIHNKLLDEARLKGMDENCKIGQGSYAYYHPDSGVKTFCGSLIAPRTNCSVSGQSITFTRAGKTYRGRLRKESDNFNFRRIK